MTDSSNLYHLSATWSPDVVSDYLALQWLCFFFVLFGLLSPSACE